MHAGLHQRGYLLQDYEHTAFVGGAPDGKDRPDEQAVLTRFALGF